MFLAKVSQSMQLHLSSWPEIEAYLAKSEAILIPIGSTEQHGPTGLVGTDALCAEFIGKRAARKRDFSSRPLQCRPGTASHGVSGNDDAQALHMIAAMVDWARSLTHHGFTRLFLAERPWRQHRTINAGFSEIYHAGSLEAVHASLQAAQLVGAAGVGDVCRQLFPVGEDIMRRHRSLGDILHASEAQKQAKMERRCAPGAIHDAADYRPLPRRPHRLRSSQASPEAGEKITAAAVKAVIAEMRQFTESE